MTIINKTTGTFSQKTNVTRDARCGWCDRIVRWHGDRKWNGIQLNCNAARIRRSPAFCTWNTGPDRHDHHSTGKELPSSSLSTDRSATCQLRFQPATVQPGLYNWVKNLIHSRSCSKKNKNLLSCTVSKLRLTICQILASDRRALHFSALAGGDPLWISP